MQRISPCLWFGGKAEEAMNFYVSIFKDSEVLSVARCGDAGPGPKGSVMFTQFKLEAQEFKALRRADQRFPAAGAHGRRHRRPHLPALRPGPCGASSSRPAGG